MATPSRWRVADLGLGCSLRFSLRPAGQLGGGATPLTQYEFRVYSTVWECNFGTFSCRAGLALQLKLWHISHAARPQTGQVEGHAVVI